jgi:hypothetical protein
MPTSLIYIYTPIFIGGPVIPFAPLSFLSWRIEIVLKTSQKTSPSFNEFRIFIVYLFLFGLVPWAPASRKTAKATAPPIPRQRIIPTKNLGSSRTLGSRLMGILGRFNGMSLLCLSGHASPDNYPDSSQEAFSISN